MTAATAVFALSLGFCVYIYAGYPALLLILERLRPRPHRRADHEPSLTVIVPAFNEESVILQKLSETLDNGYDASMLDVIVASDGSTDGTNRMVEDFGDPRVRLLALPRGGKARALNAAAGIARGEIVAFTDANIRLTPGALKNLAANFADPHVGAASANKVIGELAGATVLATGESLYWRWERWQKAAESRIGNLYAADGALHAVRRELYVPIPDHAGADDIAISVQVVLQGRRLVFDGEAVVVEAPPTEDRDELRRKVRVANQSIRALLDLGPRLWTSGFYSVELLSHKLLRYAVPLFLLLMLTSNLLLAASAGGAWSVVLAAQILFYTAAAVAALGRGTAMRRLRLLAVPYYFCLVNLAAALAIASVLRGDRSGLWEPRGGFKRKDTP